MVVLELFSGTRSISKAFEARGHEVYSVDYCEDFVADSHADIGCLGVSDVLELTEGRYPDVIWASPDCATYSVAALSRHRRKDAVTGWLMPISDYAKICDAVNQHLMRLIEALHPKAFFIENPRGGVAQDAVDAGHPALHHHLLSIRLPIHETHGHLDERTQTRF